MRLNIYIKFKPHSCLLHTRPCSRPWVLCCDDVHIVPSRLPVLVASIHSYLIHEYALSISSISPQRATSAHQNTLQLLILGGKELEN
jgi:hypothetical protein